MTWCSNILCIVKKGFKRILIESVRYKNNWDYLGCESWGSMWLRLIPLARDQYNGKLLRSWWICEVGDPWDRIGNHFPCWCNVLLEIRNLCWINFIRRKIGNHNLCIVLIGIYYIIYLLLKEFPFFAKPASSNLNC